MQKERTRLLLVSALFVALIATGAFIRVPVPYVPFTLQLFFTTLAGLYLGPKRGAAAVAAYVILGLIGVPVFTQGGGPAYVLQPTFGYLIGFILGAYLVGVLAKGKKTFKGNAFATLAGLVPVYGLGVIYLYGISHFYLGEAMALWPLLLHGIFLCMPGDVALCLVAAQMMVILHKRGR